LLIAFAVLYLVFGSKLIPIPIPHVDLAQRVLRGATFIVILLAIAKATSVYVLGRVEDASTRFTLRRVEHLIVALLITLMVVSIIFVNWYAALTALGVGSIIIGLAVQTPMKSFIA
jgi:small-conductance mechanosensitive channel